MVICSSICCGGIWCLKKHMQIQMHTNGLYGGYYLCYTSIFITIMCTYIHIFTYHKKKSHSWDDSKHLIWDFHQKNTYLKQPAASRNCWLSKWVSKLHACQLGYAYVLKNYIPIPAGVYCLQYMNQILKSDAAHVVVQHTASPRDGSHKSMAVKWEMKLYVFHQQRIHFHIQTFWLLAWKLRT